MATLCDNEDMISSNGLNWFFPFHRCGVDSSKVDYSAVFGQCLGAPAIKLCSDLTLRKRELQDVLRSEIPGKAGPKAVVKAAKTYLPLLLQLITSMTAIGTAFKITPGAKLEYKWTSVLCPAATHRRVYTNDVMLFDAVQVVVNLGLAYCSFAFELQKIKGYKHARVAYRVAAGIFDKAASDLIPTWTQGDVDDRPLECRAPVCLMLRDLALAQAEQAAIFEAGEDLSGMDPRLVALADRYKAALAHTKKAGIIIDETLFLYLSAMADTASVTALWLQAQQSWRSRKYGPAIACMSAASARLRESMSRAPSPAGELKDQRRRLFQRAEQSLAKWREDNATVYYDPVPEYTELDLSKVAAPALQPSPFKLPAPSAVSFAPVPSS